MRLIIVLLIGSISIRRNVCGFPAADDSDEAIDLSGYNLKFGLPDMASGQMVQDWKPSDPWNPEELGNYFEGDILMPKQTSSARNGINGESYRWPNGIIPFEIKGNFDSQSLSVIQKAMDTYHQKTCIKFQRRTPKDSDYISIQNSQSGCFSSIGRVGGAQTVSQRIRSLIVDCTHSLSKFILNHVSNAIKLMIGKPANTRMHYESRNGST